MAINWNTTTISSDEWESHPDLAEISTLQGRTDEEREREDDEGESSSELEEDDRDADDDEDADGDDEDDTVKADRKGLTLNMFSVLGENECAWGMKSTFIPCSCIPVSLFITDLFMIISFQSVTCQSKDCIKFSI